MYIRINLEKRSFFLKFRSSTQLFLCRRNIMEHMCSSWLMDWLYLYCLCLSPHLSLVHLQEFTVHHGICSLGNDHLVINVLLLRSTLHPPPPPDHHFLANPTMPISWPAGEKWRLHHQFFDVPRMFGLLYSDII